MAINNAIEKYGLEKFSLDILEYCNKEDTIKREQYYIDKLKPEYNLLKIAGSMFGHKHSSASKLKMSERALGRTFSAITLQKMSEAGRGRKLSESTILKIRSYTHSEEAKNKIRSASVRARSVQVTDIVTHETIKYSTMTQAAAQLNTTTATIGSYIKNNKPYLQRYLITT